LVRERGIAIVGPPPAHVIGEVPEHALREEMDYNLNVYWRARASRLERLLFDAGVDFAVQTIPRILHTLESGTIISKRIAVERLRERFPEWCALTEPAHLVRRLPRALETRRFILAMIAHANRTFGLRGSA
jgi:hypothetical protein